VEENSARGWNVLSIPSASLKKDRGRFHCNQSGFDNLSDEVPTYSNW